MKTTSWPTKVQDQKGKSMVSCSETLEKDEAKRSKRMKSTNGEGQVKSSDTLEKEVDCFLLSRK